MTLVYIDTSAAIKELVREAGSSDLLDYFNYSTSRVTISSWFLYTELHCAAERNPRVTNRAKVDEVLSRILLIDIERGDILSAAGLAGLRAGDALHLATAIRVGADELVAYDDELLRAAKKYGIKPVSPGYLAEL